ncbi:MAG: hypothetical protein ACRDZO_04330 [Egibacteraceae bacterium]
MALDGLGRREEGLASLRTALEIARAQGARLIEGRAAGNLKRRS